MRLAVALSGGADSVALLRALAARRQELGLVLHAAHLHHGLARRGGRRRSGILPGAGGKAGRAVSRGARGRGCRSAGRCESGQTGRDDRGSCAAAALFVVPTTHVQRAELACRVATAHTLDDQAETVLAKFLRGAWTEGLAGISPKLEGPEGAAIVRPLLGVTRARDRGVSARAGAGLARGLDSIVI